MNQHLKVPHESLEEFSSNEAGFECPTCSAKFNTPRDIQNHIESVHEESWSSFTLLSNADSTLGKYVPCKTCNMMFENEADLHLHMERVHEYGEECAMYPCEECGYRGQDKLTINAHIQVYHSSNTTFEETTYTTFEETTNTTNSTTNSTLEEFGVKRLPEISKRIWQNFDGLVIDKEGHIEVEESDNEYSNDDDTEKLLIDDDNDDDRYVSEHQKT